MAYGPKASSNKEPLVGKVVGTGHYLNSDSELTVAVLALLKAHSRWRG
jgi:hypothetical protein